MNDNMAKISVALFGGFSISSWYLLRKTTIIHNTKELKFKCHHISHRGGAGENLENTMTAFKHAHQLGTDMLEIDCHITKDNVVVVSHDNELYRVTGKHVQVTETNYQDLPPLLSSLDVTFSKGDIISGVDRIIPKLSDLFEAFPTTAISIDIKIDNDILIHEVSELIKLYGREEITVWGNVSDKVARKCYKENSSIPLFVSFRRALIIVLLYYIGLLPFVPIKESAFQMVMPKVYNDMGRKYFNSIQGRMFGRFLNYIIMNRKLINHLNKRGIFTCLWVLNNESDFQTAFDVGVQGVMTDYPLKLQKFLSENPQCKDTYKK